MAASFDRPAGGGGRLGFSLVELLVATTILLVIVVMTSMVFQQANGAFQSGTRRVKTQSVMRIASGAIMHDLAFMVDSDRFPGAPENSFEANEIQFIASGGNSAVVGGQGQGAVVVYRPYRCITYRFTGQVLEREEKPLEQSGGQWNARDSSGVVKLNTPDEPLHTVEFNAVWAPGDMEGKVPLRVDIHMEKETTGNATYASARSAGPDRKFDTDDDIWAGERPFGN